MTPKQKRVIFLEARIKSEQEMLLSAEHLVTKIECEDTLKGLRKELHEALEAEFQEREDAKETA